MKYIKHSGTLCLADLLTHGLAPREIETKIAHSTPKLYLLISIKKDTVTNTQIIDGRC